MLSMRPGKRQDRFSAILGAYFTARPTKSLAYIGLLWALRPARAHLYDRLGALGDLAGALGANEKS
jgi:hypothetical protein